MGSGLWRRAGQARLFASAVPCSYQASSSVTSEHFLRARPFGSLNETLQAAEIMQVQGIPISRECAYYLVRECVKDKKEEYCRRVQSLLGYSKLDSVAVLVDHLIRSFVAIGSLSEANYAFNKTLKPSDYTWNAIITGHAKLGDGEMALQLYDRMLCSDAKRDDYTYVALLQSCSMTSSLHHGRLVHNQITKNGLQNVVVGSSLLDMYARCGSLEEAEKVFNELSDRDVVLCNTMIDAYSKCGKMEDACKVFTDMADRDVVSWNSLIDGYAKSGNMKKARELFEALPTKNVVSWTALISGYAEHGEGLLALECFGNMQQEGIEPNLVTFSSILKACASVGAIDQGRQIHNQISENGLQLDVVLGNTLVDMYAKCGNLDLARQIFDKLSNRNVLSWGAMVAAYAQYGNVKLAGHCIEDMQQEHIRPSDIIFTSILAACSHAGLLNEGCRYFRSMVEDFGITPDVSHYNCIIDLLSRAGYLNEAEILVQTIPPQGTGWTSLLTACKTYGNVEIGRRCFDQIVELDPEHSSAYVIMSGIYSDSGMHVEAAHIERLRRCAGAWKKPAKAWIEVNNQVNEFVVGDKSHPQSAEIYAMLKRLSNRMKEEGYAPKVNQVLQQMSDDEKEDALCGHCEKLAIAFGLVSTPPGTLLRATKNLRVCMDCHNATKIISKIESREIIIRDVYRTHHFKDGACSCGDYY